MTLALQGSNNGSLVDRASWQLFKATCQSLLSYATVNACLSVAQTASPMTALTFFVATTCLMYFVNQYREVVHEAAEQRTPNRSRFDFLMTHPMISYAMIATTALFSWSLSEIIYEKTGKPALSTGLRVVCVALLGLCVVNLKEVGQRSLDGLEKCYQSHAPRWERWPAAVVHLTNLFVSAVPVLLLARLFIMASKVVAPLEAQMPHIQAPRVSKPFNQTHAAY